MRMNEIWPLSRLITHKPKELLSLIRSRSQICHRRFHERWQAPLTECFHISCARILRQTTTIPLGHSNYCSLLSFGQKFLVQNFFLSILQFWMALCGNNRRIKSQLLCQYTEKEPNSIQEMCSWRLTESLHLAYHIRCRCFYHLRTVASFSGRHGVFAMRGCLGRMNTWAMRSSWISSSANVRRATDAGPIGIRFDVFCLQLAFKMKWKRNANLIFKFQLCNWYSYYSMNRFGFKKNDIFSCHQMALKINKNTSGNDAFLMNVFIFWIVIDVHAGTLFFYSVGAITIIQTKEPLQFRWRKNYYIRPTSSSTKWWQIIELNMNINQLFERTKTVWGGLQSKLHPFLCQSGIAKPTGRTFIYVVVRIWPGIIPSSLPFP